MRGRDGPFPFLDGSFEVLAGVTTIFGAARVRAFASTEFERPRPPYWSHEDGLGALIHREVSERNLPRTQSRCAAGSTTAFGSTGPTCRPSSTATSSGRTTRGRPSGRTTSAAQFDGAAAVGRPQLRRLPRRVGLAGGELGLHLLHEAEAGAPAGGDALAAQEVRERGRDQPRALRRDAARGRRKTRLLAITKSNEADEGTQLREAMLRTRRRWEACVRASSSIRRLHRLASRGRCTTRVAATEMGRRADLDMSALTDDGNFEHPSRAVRDVCARWWRRAQEHAKGPRAYAAYTMTSVDELIGAPVVAARGGGPRQGRADEPRRATRGWRGRRRRGWPRGTRRTESRNLRFTNFSLAHSLPFTHTPAALSLAASA